MKRYQQLRRCARYRISCDDISSDVITINSWQSADEKRSEREKRRRVKESADGLALMTSSQSADGLSPAVARYQQVACTSSRKLLFTSRWYLEIAIAKRCRLHKLIRQRFALAIQQMLFALINQSQDPVESYSESSRKLHCYCISSRHGIQTQEKQNIQLQDDESSRKIISRSAKIQSTKNSAEAQSSSKNESAAKQLTIYKSWTSTAELNSNGENDKNPAK
ncbi:hypothetical protein F511_14461 [Dorcoceras hygrometricum]|uniref:Uncharacterized protein n=1 Tax=Dorcoceras hygrometricum TaxID=472368 RepID=A0A2Z7AMN3_9LAMI|nr:hypothetical protein F511_14461 [Dorcoceras hygrometricum]